MPRMQAKTNKSKKSPIKVDKSMEEFMNEHKQTEQTPEDSEMQNFYQYMKQLQGLKMSPGVFLTVKRDEDEPDVKLGSPANINTLSKALRMPIPQPAEENPLENDQTIKRDPLKLPTIKTRESPLRKSRQVLNKSNMGSRYGKTLKI